MHDLDRTLNELEASYDDHEFEAEYAYDDEFEAEYDDEFEFDGEFEAEYDDEFEAEYDMEFEYDDEFEAEYDMEFEFETNGVFDEEMEAELANELLTVSNDEEMEQFLGSLFSAALPVVSKIASKAIPIAAKVLPKVASVAGNAFGSLIGGGSSRRRPVRRPVYRRPTRRPRYPRRVYRRPTRRRPAYRRPSYRRPVRSNWSMARRYGRQFLRSNTGRALVGGLRYTGRRVLPAFGGDVAGYGARYFGGHQPTWRAFGRDVGRVASRAFGLELEGLSPDEQEFEVAKRFVRLAGEATKQAMIAPKVAPPKAVVKQALKIAAQKHAPGIARKMTKRQMA
ncbi:MAG: hypothetical protein AAGI08_11750 [Bacteroidota bacterium]